MDIKEEIIKEATRIFIQYGVKSQNMDLLAKKMKRSKKTIYKYFNNKAHLVNEVVSHFIKDQKISISLIVNNDYNIVDEMAYIYEFNFHLINNISPNTISNLKEYYPDAWKIFLEYKMDFLFNTILTNIKKGKKQNMYRKELNEDIIAMYYTSGVDSIFDSTLLPFNRFPVKSLLAEVFTYHIRGIASKNGINYLENEFNSKNFKYL